jgi:hypothetical protein
MENHSEDLLEIAKKNLEKDGFLTNVAVIVKDDSMNIAPLTWETNDENYKMIGLVGMACKKMGAGTVYLILDAALRQFTNPEDYKFAMANQATEAPLMYPESMRTECIIIFNVDLKAKTYTLLTQMYKKQDEKINWLEKIPALQQDAQSGIVDALLEGYTTE